MPMWWSRSTPARVTEPTIRRSGATLVVRIGLLVLCAVLTMLSPDRWHDLPWLALVIAAAALTRALALHPIGVLAAPAIESVVCVVAVLVTGSHDSPLFPSLLGRAFAAGMAVGPPGVVLTTALPALTLVAAGVGGHSGADYVAAAATWTVLTAAARRRRSDAAPGSPLPGDGVRRPVVRRGVPPARPAATGRPAAVRRVGHRHDRGRPVAVAGIDRELRSRRGAGAHGEQPAVPAGGRGRAAQPVGRGGGRGHSVRGSLVVAAPSAGRLPAQRRIRQRRGAPDDDRVADLRSGRARGQRRRGLHRLRGGDGRGRCRGRAAAGHGAAVRGGAGRRDRRGAPPGGPRDPRRHRPGAELPRVRRRRRGGDRALPATRRCRRAGREVHRAAGRDLPDRRRAPDVDLRPAQRRRQPRRPRGGAVGLRPVGRAGHRPHGAPVAQRGRRPVADRDRGRAAAHRAGGRDQRPSSRRRGQPVGEPRGRPAGGAAADRGRRPRDGRPPGRQRGVGDHAGAGGSATHSGPHRSALADGDHRGDELPPVADRRAGDPAACRIVPDRGRGAVPDDDSRAAGR